MPIKLGTQFNPLDYSPVLWLDSSDESTMYDATVGGSTVALSGRVARWEDKSNSNYDLTQATLSSRPIRLVDPTVNKPCLFFNQNVLFNDSIELPTQTIIAACKPIPYMSTGLHEGLIGYYRDSDVSGYNQSYDVGIRNYPESRADKWGFINGGDYGIICYNDVWGATVITGNTYRVNNINQFNQLPASSSILHRNKPHVVSASRVYRDAPNMLFNMKVGVGNYFKWSAVGGMRSFYGYIYEILVFNKILSNEIMQIITTRLITKWNITP